MVSIQNNSLLASIDALNRLMKTQISGIPWVPSVLLLSVVFFAKQTENSGDLDHFRVSPLVCSSQQGGGDPRNTTDPDYRLVIIMIGIRSLASHFLKLSPDHEVTPLGFASRVETRHGVRNSSTRP